MSLVVAHSSSLHWRKGGGGEKDLNFQGFDIIHDQFEWILNNFFSPLASPIVSYSIAKVAYSSLDPFDQFFF
jgi:hypothetical protein